MPAADFFLTRPGHPGLLVNPLVVLDCGGAVAGNHPRHDRPRTFIIAGIGWRQRWQARGGDGDLMLCHARNRRR